MFIRRPRDVSFSPNVKALGVGLGAWLLAASPVAALDDAVQILSGGNSISAGSTVYTAPGIANQFGIDFPGTGLGGQAAEIRLPAGKLKNLRVNVTTQNLPDSGYLTVTVRVNGANTILTCQVAGTGECAKSGTVVLAAEDRVAIRVSNNFVASGSIAYTYTLLFD